MISISRHQPQCHELRVRISQSFFVVFPCETPLVDGIFMVPRIDADKQRQQESVSNGAWYVVCLICVRANIIKP
jgi:hypothetical protein